MSEKAKRNIIIVLVVIAIISMGFAIYIASGIYFFEDENININTQEIAPDYSYVLKDVDGKIGIFMPNEIKPFIVLDIYTITLPDYDRANLLRGINVKDDTQLNQFIEDFDS